MARKEKSVRKMNAVVSALVLVLFVIHGIAGAFQMMGFLAGGQQWLTILSWTLVVLLGVHTLIGIKLTVDSVIAGKKSGVFYFKDNKQFWARRISGFSIFFLMFVHIVIFMGKQDGAYRLHVFGTLQLAIQILLLAAIAVHVISNVRPGLIALGIKGLKELAVDLLIVLSVLLLFMGVGMLIYYVRWNWY